MAHACVSRILHHCLEVEWSFSQWYQSLGFRTDLRPRQVNFKPLSPPPLGGTMVSIKLQDRFTSADCFFMMIHLLIFSSHFCLLVLCFLSLALPLSFPFSVFFSTPFSLSHFAVKADQIHSSHSNSGLPILQGETITLLFHHNLHHIPSKAIFRSYNCNPHIGKTIMCKIRLKVFVFMLTRERLFQFSFQPWPAEQMTSHLNGPFFGILFNSEYLEFGIGLHESSITFLCAKTFCSQN